MRKVQQELDEVLPSVEHLSEISLHLSLQAEQEQHARKKEGDKGNEPISLLENPAFSTE